MKGYKTAEDYIVNHKDWKQSLILLRDILLSTQLTETIKWGAPVYTLDDKNIVGLGAFMSYVGLWFFQGTLLKDKRKGLVNAQEGVTRALRQLRFNSINEIDDKLVLEYVKEAIKNHKLRKEIKPEKKTALTIPKELNEELKKNSELKNCLKQLTHFKQREYCEYISRAKRETTKKSRLENIIPMILKGKGLNDKYR